MPIKENRSYFDSLADVVGKRIKQLNPSDKQAVYRKAKKELRRAFERLKCQFFYFRKGRMGLEESNDSVLIKVGPKKRGHLAAYKGECPLDFDLWIQHGVRGSEGEGAKEPGGIADSGRWLILSGVHH